MTLRSAARFHFVGHRASARQRWRYYCQNRAGTPGMPAIEPAGIFHPRFWKGGHDTDWFAQLTDLIALPRHTIGPGQHLEKGRKWNSQRSRNW
jgi:hypothetical protein